MSIGVSSEKGALGCLPRSTIAIASNHSQYKLHEGTGTTANDTGTSGWGNMTVSGTTTNIWTNPPMLTCSGDNYMECGNVSLARELTRLDNLSGNMILMFNFYSAADPASSSVVFSASVDDSTNGGWGVLYQTTGHLRLVYRPQGNGSRNQIASYDYTAINGTIASVLVNIDTVNNVGEIYVNGTVQQSAALTSGTKPSCASANTRNYRFWANTSGTPGEIVTNGIRFSNMRIIRSETSIQSNIATIAAEQANYKEEPLWSLDGI